MLSIHLEVIPTEGIVDAVRGALPPSSSLSVTCLPKHGVAATLKTASRLSELGYTVTPHLAAKAITGRKELSDILSECAAAGISELFVIGGDLPNAAGPYGTAEELLREIGQLDGDRFTTGVAGYPEGHPRIGDDALLDSLRRKQEYASRIVTQMCFSAEHIRDYAGMLRREDITLPIRAGVAGAVPKAKLVSLAGRIGVGPSLRFLSGKGSLARRLIVGGRYVPETLIEELGAVPGIDSIQLYTFNALPAPAMPPGAPAGGE
ncbi:methylenetetrahydrofolate reductase [Arthrobacter sp. NPDC090010]|uniref:methylenetetrahydrofolate reductase n=1 Tax=Arthrobacter sp. NPDC090010 TaxID=3363942 RepID=UPI0037F2B3DE